MQNCLLLCYFWSNLNASLLNKSFVFLFTDPKLLNSSAFKTILDENFGYIYYMRL